MDPNEALEHLRQIARQAYLSAEVDTEETWAEIFLALDDWLSNGGFLPEDWQR